MYAAKTPIEKNYMVSVIDNGSMISRNSKKRQAGCNNTPLESQRDAVEKISHPEYVSPKVNKMRLPKKRIVKKGQTQSF